MTFLERMGFDVDVDVEAEKSKDSIGIVIDDKEIARIEKSTVVFRFLEASILRGVSAPIGMSGKDDILCILTGDNGRAVLMTEKERFVISEYELVLLCLAICREIEVPDSANLEGLINKGAILKFVDDKLKCYQKEC